MDKLSTTAGIQKKIQKKEYCKMLEINKTWKTKMTSLFPSPPNLLVFTLQNEALVYSTTSL